MCFLLSFLKGDVTVLDGSMMWPDIRIQIIKLAETSNKGRPVLADLMQRESISELTPTELTAFKEIIASEYDSFRAIIKDNEENQEK